MRVKFIVPINYRYHGHVMRSAGYRYDACTTTQILNLTTWLGKHWQGVLLHSRYPFGRMTRNAQ